MIVHFTCAVLNMVVVILAIDGVARRNARGSRAAVLAVLPQPEQRIQPWSDRELEALCGRRCPVPYAAFTQALAASAAPPTREELIEIYNQHRIQVSQRELVDRNAQREQSRIESEDRHRTNQLKLLSALRQDLTCRSTYISVSNYVREIRHFQSDGKRIVF